MKIVYLTPQNGYRMPLRSDSLWGLFCWGIRHLYGEQRLLDFIQASNDGKPELLLSSAFPFKVDAKGKPHLFFPKPLFPFEKKDKEANEKVLDFYRRGKKLKKITHLNQDDFQNALNGTFNNDILIQRLKNSTNLNVDWKYQAPSKNIHNVTHNTINRLTGSTLKKNNQGQLYHADEIHWEDSRNNTPTGMFFLIKDSLNLVAPILRLYSHIGLGGDASIGKGKFKFTIEDFNLDEPSDANAMVNLSLYYPTAEELQYYEANHDNFNYTLERRAGKIGYVKMHRQKPPMMMFREGSIFPIPTAQQDNYGCIKQLDFGANRPVPHDVFQYGYAFMLKMKIQ